MNPTQNSCGMRQRVVIATHSYPRFPGDWRSNFIQALAQGYRQQGAEVYVLLPETVGGQDDFGDGVKLVRYAYLPMKRWQVFGYGQAMSGDLKPNPLHVLMLPLLMIFGTIAMARLLRRQPVDLIQAHWAIPNTLIALAGRWIARSKALVFTSFPGSDVTVLSQTGAVGRILAKIIGRCDYLSCNSSDLREDLTKAGLPNERIHQVIYGVDARQIQYTAQGRERIRRQLGMSNGDAMLLVVGRFVPKKGFETAIRAMPMILAGRPEQRVQLVLVGSGVLEARLRQVVAELGLEDSVVFAGEVEHGQLPDYYSACDLFLMPSERLPSDGLNVVVVEAMACSRPVVASNVGGNDLVVFPGENGLLHKAGDAQDLAEKSLEALASGTVLATMGARGRQLAVDRFHWPVLAQHYLSRMDNIRQARHKANPSNTNP